MHEILYFFFSDIRYMYLSVYIMCLVLPNAIFRHGECSWQSHSSNSDTKSCRKFKYNIFCAVKDIWIKLIKGNSEVQSEILIVLYSQIV